MEESVYERLQRRIDRLEQELQNAVNKFADLERQLRALEGKINDVEHKVDFDE